MNYKNCFSLTVIVPCLNEEGNLAELVERTLKSCEQVTKFHNLLIIDDGSTDNSIKILKKISSKYPKVNYKSHKSTRGIVASWQLGIKNTASDIICLMDGDLQNPPEAIPNLVTKLVETGTDFCQGSRQEMEDVPSLRRALSKGLNKLLNFCFNMKAADNKSGFVVGYRENFLSLFNFNYKYSYPHTFIRIDAERKLYKFSEIKTPFYARKRGESFISNFPIVTTFRVILDVCKGLIEFRIKNKHSSPLASFLIEKHISPVFAKLGLGQRLIWWLYIKTCFFHKWIITSKFNDELKALRASQQLSISELEEYQLRRFRRLIRHAYANCLHYREAMENKSLTPFSFKKLDDIKLLPFLEKQTLREELESKILAKNVDYSKILPIVTSGSTGKPLKIYADKEQLELRFATTLRAMEWTGWKFGFPQVRLWHQTIGMSRSQIIREFIDAFFLRRKFIPAYEISDDNLTFYFEKIMRTKPVLIDGYAESFNFLARYLAHSETNIRHKPNAIMSSAQILPENVRELIEQRFGCKVYDKYGSREFSGIAYEDGTGTGHLVQMESYHVEILKNGKVAKPGETGEIVITDLNNYCVPLIRYRIGDLATAPNIDEIGNQKIQFHRIGKIQGRTQALVHCKNGKWLPGTFFAHFFKDYAEEVRHYQVIQQKNMDILLKLVLHNLADQKTVCADIVSSLRKYVGDETNIEATIVKNIDMGRTGKRTPVVSKVNIDFQKV